jgi:hypothetical protein
MKNKILLTVVCCLAASGLWGSEYGGEFLNIGAGARSQGLGGAFGPLASDASAVYWNPAGLAANGKPEIAFCHTQLFGGLANHDFLAVSWPVTARMTLGLGWLRLGVDDIPRFSYNIGTEPEGSFGDNENAFFIAPAISYDWKVRSRNIKCMAGIGMKLIYNKLDDRQATGLGMDAGILIRSYVGDWFYGRSSKQIILGVEPVNLPESSWGIVSFSLVAQDVGGTNISWNTATQHQDIRPANYKIGAGYQIPLKFMRSDLAFAWETATEEYQKGRVGMELSYRKTLMLRAGRDQEKLVWGGGLRFWRLQLDYAFTPHELGNTHRVGCLFKI